MNNFRPSQTAANDVLVIERSRLEMTARNSRHNLLLVVVFSLINVLMLALGGNMYFLFSASIPYILTDFAMYFCGRYPDEVYTPEELESGEFFGTGVFIAVIAVAIVCIAAYFVCWLLSKRFGIGWIIAALVAFVIDTASMFMFYGISMDSLFDIGFHAWVIISLTLGIVAHFKLKKLPVPEPAPIQINLSADQPESTESVQIENIEAESIESTDADQKESAEDDTEE